jgi:hypothetical protein
VEIGQVLVANESEFTESAGDFFAFLSGTQLLVLPAATLGLFLCIAPRLFFRWAAGLPSGMAQTGIILGSIVVAAATVFSVGGFVTAIARSSDDDFDVGTGDWTAQLGIALLAIAALVLVFTAIVVVRAADTRQLVQPIE